VDFLNFSVICYLVHSVAKNVAYAHFTNIRSHSQTALKMILFGHCSEFGRYIVTTLKWRKMLIASLQLLHSRLWKRST